MSKIIDPKSVKLFHAPRDQFRMTVDQEYSVVMVEPKWAAPLSHPGKNLGLLNAKGEELVMFQSLEDVEGDSRLALEAELSRRYLTSTIHKILHAKVEYGSTYWTVITERGERDFVAQSLQENAQWMGPSHLLLVDIDGNRFEIPDVNALDPKSREYIETIV